MRGFGVVGNWWTILDEATKTSIQNRIVDYLAAHGAPLNVTTVRTEAIAALRRAGSYEDFWSPTRKEPLIASQITEMILEGYARPVAEGGGFVVEEARAGLTGRLCLCPGSSLSEAYDPTVTARMRSEAPPLADGRCPPGTGGVPLPVPVQLVARVPSREMYVIRSPTLGISGRVVDSAGAPVAGATVSVGPPAGRPGGAGSFANVTTAADGRFSIVRKAGTYDLQITATGYQSTSAAGVIVTTTGITNMGDVPVAAEGEPPVTDPCMDSANAWMEECGGDGVPPGADPCADSANAWMVECGGSGTRPKTEVEKPWYSSPWVWVAGGLVLLVGVYAVYKTSKG